jgi:hypothetical protein
MFDWFEKLVRDIIWKAMQDFFRLLPALGEQMIRDKLKSLTAGQQLSSSPLVTVLAVDNAADTLTFLVRGSFSFEGLTPFMRLEVVVSRSDIDLSLGEPPVRVKRWQAVLGDLRVEKKNALDGELGFGYDHGAWIGQGSLKLLPIKAGAAIYGGISDRGMVLGLDAEMPPGAAIPLGPTGLGLRGLGGDFAYNFVARLEKAGLPIANPAAKDYVTWARDHNIDRWKPGPIDKTAVGVGIRTVLCTLADQGFVFELNPIGFSFLTPGGAIILGGKGVLLRRKGFGAEGYFVVDVASASLALGAAVNVEIKAPPEELGTAGFATLLKGFAQLDAFFSFSDPTAWFFDLGTEAKPCLLEVLTDVPVINILFSEKAEAYLRINHHRIAFGAKVGLGGEYKISKLIQLIARLAVSLAAYVGWDPLLVRAKLTVIGELGIRVWKFSFLLTGEASPIVYLPSPTLFSFELKYKLALPWPLPDIEGKKTFGDNIATPPRILSPLLAGEAVADGAITVQAQKVVATHVPSELQWNLATEKPWPDLELVVPFRSRVTDNTGAIVGPVVSPTNEGGYDVKHELNKLELLDLEHMTVVPDVKGIWADGPGGDTALLHLLGSDPLSWLTPHADLSAWTSVKPPQVVQVFFGFGPNETFADDRSFGDLHVKPTGKPAALDGSFAPALPTRVLRGNELLFRVIDAGGAAIPVEQVILFLVHANEATQGEPLVTKPSGAVVMAPVGKVFGSLNLVAAVLDFAPPTTGLTVSSASGNDLLVFAVRYREVRQVGGGIVKKLTLVPGRYRLTVEGKSTAVHKEFSAHPDLYPSAPAIDWHVQQEFEVTYPSTVRRHIRSATFGDNRLFSKPQHPWTTWPLDAWNPALYGFGFPLYRHYHLAVRFLVPYIGGIFGATPLKLQVVYEQGGEVTQAVAPTAVPDGTSSLLPQSQNWITAHGGTVPADVELVLPTLLPKAGTATLNVLFTHPTRGDVRLDQWTGYVSAFGSFGEHLAWPAACLTVRYDAAGRHVDPPCATIGHGGAGRTWEKYVGAHGIEPLPKGELKVAGLLSEALLPGLDGLLTPYPSELSSPPLAWRLGGELVAQVGPLGADAGVRYARFAAATGARFGATGDAISGIQDPVTATTIEAVVDAAGRPVVLWLRTPEPVDWRRVSLTLRVSHVTPTVGCPTGYAHRLPLELTVGVLPSPDGSSAFLTGALAGAPTRLPRGEYELTLRLDPAIAGLPALRPSILVGAGPEVVKLRFLQPYGEAWPLPSGTSVIRHDLVQLALKYVKFDPKIWEDAVLQGLPAEVVEPRLLASIRAARASVAAEGPTAAGPVAPGVGAVDGGTHEPAGGSAAGASAGAAAEPVPAPPAPDRAGEAATAKEGAS